MFALAAFLWLPVSAHCQLETIPGLEFLRCVSDNQSRPNQGHCGDTGCCSAEKSQYKSEQLRLTLPSPDLMPIPATPLTPLSNLANGLPDEVSLGILTAAPPESLKNWQFLSRTALPVRAPSIAS